MRTLKSYRGLFWSVGLGLHLLRLVPHGWAAGSLAKGLTGGRTPGMRGAMTYRSLPLTPGATLALAPLVVAVFSLSLSSEKLDKELMMSGVMQCKGRRDMMADMEVAMKAFIDNESEGLLAQATPDEYFLRLDQMAFEAGHQHYDTKSRYSSCEALYDEWRTTRHALLDRRRDIRGQLGQLSSMHPCTTKR